MDDAVRIVAAVAAVARAHSTEPLRVRVQLVRRGGSKLERVVQNIRVAWVTLTSSNWQFSESCLLHGHTIGKQAYTTNHSAKCRRVRAK